MPIDNPALVEAPTKELFVPCYWGTNPNIIGFEIDAGGEEASVMLLVPQDFSSITSIKLILVPGGTGASMHFSFLTRWGTYAGGEAFNVHTETATHRDIGATVIDENMAYDISDLVDVAALAAGDLLSVRITYSATVIKSDARIRGLRLKYS